jgi:hypothetical protein
MEVVCYEKQLCCVFINEDVFFATSVCTIETKPRFMKEAYRRHAAEHTKV